MSDTLDINAEGSEQGHGRRNRNTGGRNRPEPEGYADDKAISFETAHPTISPEDALADSRAQIEAANAQAAAARRETEEANRRAAEAAAQLNQAAAARVSDFAATAAATAEAATNALGLAKAAYKAARESGDIDAEVEAQTQIGAATADLRQAKADLARVQQAQPQRQQPQQQQPSGPSPEAQRWIDEHPAYHTDKLYRGRAVQAHNDAIAAGNQSGSRAYVDFIENEMRAEFGDDHGKVPGTRPQQGGRQDMSNTRAQQPRSDSAPPSRNGGGGQNSGYREVKIPGHGSLFVQATPTGGQKIRFESPEQRALFQEFADLSKLSLEQYAQSMTNEGFDDLKTGEGQRF